MGQVELHARNSEDARMATEAEVVRLQNEIIRIQQGQETEFSELSSEIERLRAELASKADAERQLVLEREQHDRTKEQLAARPEPSSANPVEIEVLQNRIQQQERMIDNTLRLQTRAELGLQRSMQEAKREMDERRKVESMMQQLMDRLDQLPNPRVFSRVSSKANRKSHKDSKAV